MAALSDLNAVKL